MRPLPIVLAGLLLFGLCGPISPTAAQEPDPLPTWMTAISSSAHGEAIGYSCEGREITAYRIGQGPIRLALIGGIHGGYEYNTVELMVLALNHFTAHPEEVPPAFSLYIIPLANPDGLARGPTLEGRFNARGVDLNRNWGGDWQRKAFWREQLVHAGEGPFSEPETVVLRDWIEANDLDAVLFYHSQAGTVTAAHWTKPLPLGEELAGQMAKATGYDRPWGGWSIYPVSGTAGVYLSQQGIVSLTIELSTHKFTEWERNLAGLHAAFDLFSGTPRFCGP